MLLGWIPALTLKLYPRPQLKEQYAAFIKEYLELGHMSPAPADASVTGQYFLPHDCVLKKDRSTTKLRVVFDGFAVTTSAYSLNDVFMSGPVIQPKLLHILLRFRSHRVAITGAISKMYRCVRGFPEDSYLQCILWRDSTQDELQAEILRRYFYLDDLLSGGGSIDEAFSIMQQTSGILAKRQFWLRKWCSNVADVLDKVPEEDRESFLKFDDGSTFTKTQSGSCLGSCN
ncbi:uncharacterized protein [Drosophila bipectinata]|uniref:uncharacterized protein n=1 Tax=Drosophila bipectinata TaxID=42026 RepID=UPI0038B3334C